MFLLSLLASRRSVFIISTNFIAEIKMFFVNNNSNPPFLQQHKEYCSKEKDEIRSIHRHEFAIECIERMCQEELSFLQSNPSNL